jgi:hypothetical protein
MWLDWPRRPWLIGCRRYGGTLIRGRSARDLLRAGFALVLGAGAVGMVGWAQQSGLASPHLSGRDESLVTAGYALARFGVDGVPAGLRRYAELAPVAEYGRRTGAFDRGIVATGRELMLVATLVAAVLLWGLARRLVLSGPAAAGAVLLFGLAPWALAAHQHPDPAALALPWLMAAGLASTYRRPGWVVWPAFAVCVAMAALTVPVAGVAVTGRTVLLLAWPLAALGLAWLAAGGWRRLAVLQTPEGSTLPVRIGLGVTLAALAGIAGVAGRNAWRPAGDDDPQRAAAAARGWVLANAAGTPRVAVDDLTWVELVRAGYPADRLVSGGGLGPAAARRVPGGWRGIDLVVAEPGRVGGVATVAVAALLSSREQARFEVAGSAREVRYVVPDLTVAVARGERERAACQTAGEALAGNPRLRLSPEARQLLRDGDVDPRLISVLAGIVAAHALNITDFPAVPGEADTGVQRRTIRIAGVDGGPAGGSAGLTEWLAAQLTPYRPARVTTDRTDLVVRYDSPTPVGLLTS